jgi:hypothetical protein
VFKWSEYKCDVASRNLPPILQALSWGATNILRVCLKKKKKVTTAVCIIECVRTISCYLPSFELQRIPLSGFLCVPMEFECIHRFESEAVCDDFFNKLQYIRFYNFANAPYFSIKSNARLSEEVEYETAIRLCCVSPGVRSLAGSTLVA